MTLDRTEGPSSDHPTAALDRTKDSASVRARRRYTPARLSLPDAVRTGANGVRTRPMRALLSALGIAIGIAAMTAVVGISSSGRADLDRELAKIGTNLLTVTPGQTFTGQAVALPDEATAMVSRVPAIAGVSGTGLVRGYVYRHDRMPAGETNGIAVLAARTSLLTTVGGVLAQGVWHTSATEQGQAVVLGARSAEYLGIRRPGPEVRVWLAQNWFTVIGILAPNPLAAQLDTSALIGWPVARRELGFDGHATTLYTRIRDDRVTSVQPLLARTVNPEHPEGVRVERPSDAIAAKHAADRTFTGLLVGLGAVALLVGGIGVANTMIISVLERRAEIGLRRALGATRGQIRNQFLTESLLLSLLGGVGGVLLGIAVTGAYATSQQWPTVVPGPVQAGAVGLTVLIGGMAGLYPAIRAARLSPVTALSAL